MWCLVRLPCLASCFTPTLSVHASSVTLPRRLNSKLPPRIRRTQAEEGFARRLHVRRQAGGMLHGDVNVAEMALERIALVDGVGAGRMEDQVNGADCLVHAM